MTDFSVIHRGNGDFEVVVDKPAEKGLPVQAGKEFQATRQATPTATKPAGEKPAVNYSKITRNFC